jgi:hypothetical protein
MAFAQTRVAKKMHALFWRYNYAVVCALVGGLMSGMCPLIAQMCLRGYSKSENLRKVCLADVRQRLKFFLYLTNLALFYRIRNSARHLYSGL